MKTKVLTLALLPVFVTTANANLLTNPSFETVPGTGPGFQGQGILPSSWDIVNPSPDTYSNDGSFGVSPSDFGNFTGVTAQDGIRWIAGWSLAFETFGQTLTAPLSPGVSYTLSGYLHQALRSDLDFPGGYKIYLTSDNTGNIGTGASLGQFGPTSDTGGWEAKSLTFTAPANAGALPFLYFVPFDTGSGSAYPGLDNLSLTSAGVPDSGATLWLTGLSLALAFLHRRSQQSS